MLTSLSTKREERKKRQKVGRYISRFLKPIRTKQQTAVLMDISTSGVDALEVTALYKLIYRLSILEDEV